MTLQRARLAAGACVCVCVCVCVRMCVCVCVTVYKKSAIFYLRAETKKATGMVHRTEVIAAPSVMPSHAYTHTSYRTVVLHPWGEACICQKHRHTNLKSYLTPIWKAVFHCSFDICISDTDGCGLAGSKVCSFPPLTAPNSDIMIYWHNLEYTCTSLQQGEKFKPLDISKGVIEFHFKFMWNLSDVPPPIIAVHTN